MKAISLWQPWASLIAMKLKVYETRSWATNYRGDLLICAAKKATFEQEQAYDKILWKYQLEYPEQLLIGDDCIEFEDLPKGCAIALVSLTDCIQMTNEFINQQSELEKDCGDWQAGRFAWKLENIRTVANTPIVGKQGLFNIEFKEKENV